MAEVELSDGRVLLDHARGRHYAELHAQGKFELRRLALRLSDVISRPLRLLLVDPVQLRHGLGDAIIAKLRVGRRGGDLIFATIRADHCV